MRKQRINYPFYGQICDIKYFMNKSIQLEAEDRSTTSFYCLNFCQKDALFKVIVIGDTSKLRLFTYFLYYSRA